jgi:hypothetical protein
LHVGRSIAAIAAASAVSAFLYVVLHRHDDAYTAFTRALLAAALVMAVLGAGERFWRGATVKRAGLDGGGPSIEFEDQISKAVAQVNDRMNDQVDSINNRLYDLERTVFKEDDQQADREE